jgi:hypothetical protein
LWVCRRERIPTEIYGRSDGTVTNFDCLIRAQLENGKVKLEAFGLDDKLCPLPLPCELDESELPDWLSRKLAVLMVMPYEPPTKFIPNVGRRIMENVFWVSTGDQTNGDDP